MTVDHIAIGLIIAAAPAATLFPIIYGITSPFYRSAVGRALFTKAVGLALLIDISIAYHFFGDNYAARDIVRLTVFSLITLGVWLQLGALIYEKRRGHRSDFDNDDH